MISAISNFQNRNNTITFNARSPKNLPVYAEALKKVEQTNAVDSLNQLRIITDYTRGVAAKTASELLDHAVFFANQAVELLKNKGTGTIKVPFEPKFRKDVLKKGRVISSRLEMPHYMGAIPIKSETLLLENGTTIKRAYKGSRDQRVSQITAWVDFPSGGGSDKTTYGEGFSRKTVSRRSDGTQKNITKTSKTGRSEVETTFDKKGEPLETRHTYIDKTTWNRKTKKIINHQEPKA